MAVQLFAEVSAELSKLGVSGFAISRYAVDNEIAKILVLTGFGIRCSDAILKLSERKIIEKVDQSLTFMELSGNEKKRILHLKKSLCMHLIHAPVFLFSKPLEADEWITKGDIRVIAVNVGEQIAGFMAFDDEAETFVSQHQTMANICGAYVGEAYRGSGIAAQLLEYVCRLCESEGKEYLGVDCETLNPAAMYFWRKYFQSYTYSFERRIDERTIGL